MCFQFNTKMEEFNGALRYVRYVRSVVRNAVSCGHRVRRLRAVRSRMGRCSCLLSDAKHRVPQVSFRNILFRTELDVSLLRLLRLSWRPGHPQRVYAHPGHRLRRWTSLPFNQSINQIESIDRVITRFNSTTKVNQWCGSVFLTFERVFRSISSSDSI